VGSASLAGMASAGLAWVRGWLSKLDKGDKLLGSESKAGQPAQKLAGGSRGSGGSSSSSSSNVIRDDNHDNNNSSSSSSSNSNSNSKNDGLAADSPLPPPKPLLLAMTEPDHPSMQAIRAFRYRTLVAFVEHDFLVPHASAALTAPQTIAASSHVAQQAAATAASMVAAAAPILTPHAPCSPATFFSVDDDDDSDDNAATAAAATFSSSARNRNGNRSKGKGSNGSSSSSSSSSRSSIGNGDTEAPAPMGLAGGTGPLYWSVAGTENFESPHDRYIQSLFSQEALARWRSRAEEKQQRQEGQLHGQLQRNQQMEGQQSAQEAATAAAAAAPTVLLSSPDVSVTSWVGDGDAQTLYVDDANYELEYDRRMLANLRTVPWRRLDLSISHRFPFIFAHGFLLGRHTSASKTCIDFLAGLWAREAPDYHQEQ
jgi:hypothetical protein